MPLVFFYNLQNTQTLEVKKIYLLLSLYLQCYKNAKNKHLLKNACSYSECSSLTYCAFFVFTKFWDLCFSKQPVFEILFRRERCNDDTLSIMLHNNYLVSYDGHFSFIRQSKKQAFHQSSVFVLSVINLSLKAKVKERVKI